MKIRRAIGFRSGLIILVAAFLGQACGDKTLQDYRNQQANADAHALAPAANTYTGMVTALGGGNSETGTALGNLAISLRVDEIPQPSSDNLGTEYRAALNGTVHYVGVDGLTGDATITNATYDSSSGQFSTTVGLTDDDNASYSMEIEGNIANGHMTGTIMVDSNVNFGGKIDLSTNSSQIASSQQLSTSDRGLELSAESGVFEGTLAGAPVSLTINDRDTSASQTFLQIFSPIHLLDVVVNDGNPISMGTGSGSTAQLDDETGQLKGHGVITVGGFQITAYLSCQAQYQGKIVNAWDCTFQNNHVLFTRNHAGSATNAAGVPANGTARPTPPKKPAPSKGHAKK
ncbi:MAG: hypothetical protein P4M08_04000 [Oligoflexia bacterium]|nr:hypothetical protein [Oligoflexia bacterium]